MPVEAPANADAVVTYPLVANPELVAAIASATERAITMCGLSTRCVGVSSLPTRDPATVTGLIGLQGRISGFATLAMEDRFALKAVGGLLGDQFPSLNNQVIDGVGEITNVIAGGIKSSLVGSSWQFSQITVPNVIVGTGYQFAYARGLTFVNVTFEHLDDDAIRLEERIFNVSMSLMQL